MNKDTIKEAYAIQLQTIAQYSDNYNHQQPTNGNKWPVNYQNHNQSRPNLNNCDSPQVMLLWY